jgi:hypothetical protein
MDPLIDPRCLVTTEAVVVDGANGICRDSRLRSHVSGAAAAVALVALVAGLAWFSRERVSLTLRRAALVLTLAIASIPGLYAVLAVRADRPAEVDRSARRIARTEDEIRAFAAAHRCAWIRTQSGSAAVPIARLAITGYGPSAPGCETPAPIDLFADALEGGCTDVDGTLRCGTVDDDTQLDDAAPRDEAGDEADP